MKYNTAPQAHPITRRHGCDLVQQENRTRCGLPEQGVGCAAVVMRHPVAHLQTQAEVHLIGHTESEAHRRRRVRLRAAHQALAELVGQGVLHAPLRHLQGDARWRTSETTQVLRLDEAQNLTLHWCRGQNVSHQGAGSSRPEQ